jgi:GTP-binding protein
MAETWEFRPPHFVTSAIRKTGRKQLLDYINGLNADISRG